LSSTDKIAPLSNQEQLPTPTNPSDSAFADLNSSTASQRNFSSYTIFDLPVTTAQPNHSTWLPSPTQTSATRQQPTQQNQQFFPPQQDFVLFEQTRPQQRRQPALSPLGHTFNAASAAQFYSNSAPSSTVNIRPQSTTPARPPVPLFNSNSTSNIHQHNNQQPANMNNDFAHSFDGLDADYGAGFDNGDLWDQSAASFTAINTGASSTRTVSPKDIFSDSLGSAPPSTAFTNLTSPDINESPYMDSYETSPLFNDNSELEGDTSNWYPLFTDNDASAAAPMERNHSNISLQTSSSGNSPLILDSSNRRKSSHNASPLNGGHSRQASVTGGVAKQRRRKGPLPPIAVDPEDKTALKRARNTLAARDSRQRKLDHISTLERRIAELEEREQQFKETLVSFGYSGQLLQ